MRTSRTSRAAGVVTPASANSLFGRRRGSRSAPRNRSQVDEQLSGIGGVKHGGLAQAQQQMPAQFAPMQGLGGQQQGPPPQGPLALPFLSPQAGAGAPNVNAVPPQAMAEVLQLMQQQMTAFQTQILNQNRLAERRYQDGRSSKQREKIHHLCSSTQPLGDKGYDNPEAFFAQFRVVFADYFQVPELLDNITMSI